MTLSKASPTLVLEVSGSGHDCLSGLDVEVVIPNTVTPNEWFSSKSEDLISQCCKTSIFRVRDGQFDIKGGLGFFLPTSYFYSFFV